MARIAEVRNALSATLPAGVDAIVATGQLPRDPKVAQTMGGGLSRQFVICVKTGSPDDTAAQEQLDELLEPAGTGSVQAALEADTTLGGQVDHLEVVAVTGWRHYARLTDDGQTVPVLGAEITVEIAA